MTTAAISSRPRPCTREPPRPPSNPRHAGECPRTTPDQASPRPTHAPATPPPKIRQAPTHPRPQRTVHERAKTTHGRSAPIPNFEVRTRLESYDLYKHEGAQKLTDADREALDFATQVERSRTAATIHARLFGEGMDFLRGRYPQQATQMAARLDWLARKQLDDDFAELITPEWADLLKICQARYEAMISERSTRDRKSAADLRDLRNRLRMQIYAYCGAIGSMLDPDAAESAKLVETALRPILSYRAQNRRKGAGEELIEDTAEPSIDEAEGTDTDAADIDAPDTAAAE